mmetsp:Transcript_27301/g.56593  ORF Transcript_27301/g.56593 Transcript_27301/m.56593 type:complete len:363 (+) Transcript_27301:712-1800(+)
MRPSKWIPKKYFVGSFFLVTDHQNKKLQKEQCIHLDPTLTDQFLVPNLSCFLESSTMKQSFHVLDNNDRKKVVDAFKNGIDINKFDSSLHQVIDCHRQPSYLSTYIIEENLKMEKNYNGFTQIFAGGGSPPVHDFDSFYQVASSSVTVHYRVSKISDFSNYVPLSTGCFDFKFHRIQVIDKFLFVIEKGIGRSGLFPIRSRTRHAGSASYIGERSENSQSRPSLCEGPGEHGRFYYQSYINHAFWPFCLSLYNLLGQAASRLDWYIYKFMTVLFPFRNMCSSALRFSRLLIATIDFKCSNHVDKVDEVSETYPIIFDQLTTIFNHSSFAGDLLEQAKNTKKFLMFHKSPVPTTCYLLLSILG